MAFEKREISSENRYPNQVKFNKIGDSVEGTYLGSEVKEINGSAKLEHSFKAADGTIKTTLGSADLNAQLEQLARPGDMVRATYTSSKKIPGRPLPMKVYTIEIDADLFVDVSSKVTKLKSSSARPEGKQLA